MLGMFASVRNVSEERYPIFANIETGRVRQISVSGRYRCEIALNSVWEHVGAIKWLTRSSKM